jgi:ArsR family transcriptional regulator
MSCVGNAGVKVMIMPARTIASEGVGGFNNGQAMLSYEKRSEILRALAHPARMEIVMRLEKDGCNVSKIQKNLGMPQSTISQHLRVLKNAGIVSCHREGTQVCYRVEMPGILDIVEMLGRM